MQGVFSVAGELTRLGFIVSLTSRNAFGADLLVTDQKCERSWSVQSENEQPANELLVIGGTCRKCKVPDKTPGGTCYSFDQSDLKPLSLT
jgi:hypothetical protein